MKTKVLQVFYNENGLPFKDQERTVHFPVVGSGFMGASNTTQIKFYFKEIGDDAVKYVAVSKLPNGKVGSKVLENYYDSELDEPYALLELDSYYTQYKGDLFISLQGYQGGVQVTYDEDTELYEIEGTPTIQATGSIKFTNNYATQFVGSGEEQNITLQQLLAIISNTVLRYYVNPSNTLAEVFNEIGTKICAIDIEGDEYLCEMSGNTNIVIYDIHNQEWYAFTGANTTTIDSVLQDSNKQIIATKEDLENFGNLFTYKGTASVSEINALTDIGNGWCYNLTDSGTLTLGNLQVETGDNVAFDGSVWTKLSSETVLGQYYTKEEGQDFETQVDNRVDAIENQVQQVAQGSPKGVYSTLAALQAAYPTGTSGIYVVSADGHWYYWNGSAWTDGGTYQATQIADGSVTREKLASSLTPKMLLQYESTSYKNLNDAPKNSVLCYSNLEQHIDEYSNYPVAQNGTLLCLNGWGGASSSSNLGDIQIYITYEGATYSRACRANNTFSSWARVTNESDLANYLKVYVGQYTTYKDFNTVPVNSVICFVSMNASEYSHYPTLDNGTLVTLNAYNGGTGTYPYAVTVQMYFTQNANHMYIRSGVVNSWTAWTELAVGGDHLLTAYWGQYNSYKDFNNAPNNSVICYSMGSFDGFSNYPIAQTGTLITFNGYQSGSNIAKTQIYITSLNDVYTRISWGGGAVFTAWKKLSTYDETLYYHKYKDYLKKSYSFEGKTAVFFGDSITYGWLSGNNRVEHPYPELFSDAVGLTGYNEAVSASAFTPNSNSQTNIIINQAINSTHKSVDYVFVAGGCNDCGFGVELSDMKTYVNNFIDYVLENYPNAQLIFITPINRLDGYDSVLQLYRNIITECAITKDDGRISVVQGNDFDFPNLTDNSDFRSALYSDSLHPTQKGYSTAYLHGLLKSLVK